MWDNGFLLCVLHLIICGRISQDRHPSDGNVALWRGVFVSDLIAILTIIFYMSCLVSWFLVYFTGSIIEHPWIPNRVFPTKDSRLPFIMMSARAFRYIFIAVSLLNVVATIFGIVVRSLVTLVL